MIKFIKLKKKHLQTVLDWRVQKEISQFMLTEIDYSIDKQYKWFERISADKSKAYWIIEYQGKEIGLINLAEIDFIEKKCKAGIYIGNLNYRQLTAFLLPYFYNFVFKKLEFNKIYGEVLSSNKSIIKIHMLHGYRYTGKIKNQLKKNGRSIDLILLELIHEEWCKQKRYQRYEAEFEAFE